MPPAARVKATTAAGTARRRRYCVTRWTAVFSHPGTPKGSAPPGCGAVGRVQPIFGTHLPNSFQLILGRCVRTARAGTRAGPGCDQAIRARAPGMRHRVSRRRRNTSPAGLFTRPEEVREPQVATGSSRPGALRDVPVKSRGKADRCDGRTHTTGRSLQAEGRKRGGITHRPISTLDMLRTATNR